MSNRIFDTLKNIVQNVNDASTLEQALDITVQRIRQVMKVDAVSVYFCDANAKQLVLMATDGLNPDAVGKIRFNFDQGLVGLVFNQAELLNIKDAHSHSNYCFVTETNEASFHGFLGVPIIQHRHVLGVLVVRQTLHRRFSSNDETFLVTLAAQLAGAISHAEKMGEVNRLIEGVEEHSYNMKGIAGSPGIAIGDALVLFPPASLMEVPDSNISGDEIEEHIGLFRQAVSNVENEYKQLSRQMQASISAAELALFDVFGLMLKSDSLIDAVISRIRAGQWAQGALRETISVHVKKFNDMEDAYLRERAVDIMDLGRRLLIHLQQQKVALPDVSAPVVLVAEEVTVSQFAEVPLQHLVAIVSTKGSASSHVAILAHALNIPSVMGIDDLPVSRIKGQKIIVDGYGGQVFVKPSKTIIDEFRRLIREESIINAELSELIDLPSETIDGLPVALQVNTGLLEDISPSIKSGAEGVGLYRTEIPFIMCDGFPGEEEQAVIYKQVLQSFSPRPVTFRTLDIGGDKALPYFPVEEENPFLGWRGIRIMLDHPDIFLTQIRAILKSNIYGNNLRLMLPMVSDVAEVDDAVSLIKKAHRELISEGVSDLAYPQIGVMIEVPSAVYQMQALARRVDFFSIGSNDLTQYLLAVDRNNKQVAELYNSLHPSVLHAIQHIVSIAKEYNKPVSVCGEMAGDPASALILLGMGIDSLSMSVGSLLRVKRVVRSFTTGQAQALAKTAMKMEKASDIRLLLNTSLDDAGLGGLIRAGK
ncbi:MAG: phosphoenolpyruvate--protein phosphotransferase [Gammaproteobacteria bacterium]|nr:phosphoenolpyruvate--protein phosphotransferase [Gammaproteobacteria bacterium]